MYVIIYSMYCTYYVYVMSYSIIFDVTFDQTDQLCNFEIIIQPFNTLRSETVYVYHVVCIT